MPVKTTGFGRGELDVADPTALMVASDLRSTRARRPYADSDRGLVVDAAGERVDAVLYDKVASVAAPTAGRAPVWTCRTAQAGRSA
ncbi:hypothetical protein [Streptomyces sp. NPDC051219]|uniref:hypothetical protein n=1 Tax=Streptomyces sp. NPDC051219 TaxID=3155283 RepID=UPI00343656CD